jgi:archaeal flagellin FlaB
LSRLAQPTQLKTQGDIPMNAKLNRLMKDESGITALETAIILIAFVVVAAIFAFTVLSTGTFLTEKSKEAAYAGLQEVRGSMELKGGVVVSSSVPNQVDYVAFTLATVAGGSPVDLSTTNAKVQISYRDIDVNKVLTASTGTGAVTYTVGAGKWYVNTCTNCGGADPAWILTPGALARIYAYVPSNAQLKNNQTFALEIKPPTGGTMLLERTLPAALDSFTDLH